MQRLPNITAVGVVASRLRLSVRGTLQLAGRHDIVPVQRINGVPHFLEVDADRLHDLLEEARLIDRTTTTEIQS